MKLLLRETIPKKLFFRGSAQRLPSTWSYYIYFTDFYAEWYATVDRLNAVVFEDLFLIFSISVVVQMLVKRMYYTEVEWPKEGR